MARYYFVVEDQDDVVRNDEVGADFPDLHLAVAHARVIALQLASEWKTAGHALSSNATVRVLSSIGEGLRQVRLSDVITPN
jgi:hypothetical protein